MLHKTGKPEDLIGSYGLLVLHPTSVNFWKRLYQITKATGQNITKNSIINRMATKKNRSIKENLSKLFETMKFDFHIGHSTTGIFLDVEKASDQVWFKGFLFKLTSMALNRKLIRSISNFLCQRKLIISINNQLSDPINPIHAVPQGSPLSSIPFILYVSDISKPNDA